jgi:hypothetical protein
MVAYFVNLSKAASRRDHCELPTAQQPSVRKSHCTVPSITACFPSCLTKCDGLTVLVSW